MKKRLTHITPLQTAWTLAVVYFLIAIIAYVISMIVGLTQGQGVEVLWGLIGIVVYPLVMFAFVVIGIWLYNWVASWTGGVEFTLKDK